MISMVSEGVSEGGGRWGGVRGWRGASGEPAHVSIDARSLYGTIVLAVGSVQDLKSLRHLETLTSKTVS